MKTKHISRRFRRFLRANKAVSALEYAILVGVVAVAVGAALTLFGGQISTAVDTVGKNIISTHADKGNEKASPSPSPSPTP